MHFGYLFREYVLFFIRIEFHRNNETTFVLWTNRFPGLPDDLRRLRGRLPLGMPRTAHPREDEAADEMALHKL
jgi:hypothetical protein